MTSSMQAFIALKTETSSAFRGPMSSESLQSSEMLNMSPTPRSLDLDETENPDFRRIYQELRIYLELTRQLEWNSSRSISSTAGRVDIPASEGVSLAFKDIGIQIAGTSHPELHDALRDLDGAKDEADEEGFPAPSNTALEHARTILCAAYELSPRRYEVYPTPDGEVAIDAPGGLGRSVLLLCESDGGALCLVNMDGSHRRARYSDAKGLPDGFVREALAELERRNEPAT